MKGQLKLADNQISSIACANMQFQKNTDIGNTCSLSARIIILVFTIIQYYKVESKPQPCSWFLKCFFNDL